MASEPLMKKAKYEGLKAHSVVSPRAVLADKYVRDNETVQVFVAEITDQTHSSRLIRELNSVFPMGELSHLRRIKTCQLIEGNVLQIILCQVRETGHQEDNEISLENIFQDRVINLEGVGQPFITDVPLYQPLTRQQFKEASKLWPTNFHEDKHISNMINGELFDKEALENIAQFMEMAIQAALSAKEFGMIPVGAVIVDPQRNKVVAVGHDLSKSGHPLQHAVMVCIDLVARSQLGGAWSLNCKEYEKVWKLSKRSNVCDRDEPNSSAATQCHKTTCKYLDSNMEEEKTGEEEQFEQECVHERDRGSDEMKSTCNSCSSSGPYLCTGYDVYVTREPCVMCAMALVHSRIRRVFYGCSYPSYGALGSQYKLHTQAGLNHHYEVFSGVLGEECQSALCSPDLTT